METKVNAPKILIVDDEIGPRESLRMILKPMYTVYTVENGYAAIEMLKQTQPDVVTLDLKMPGLSGIDTLKEIRRIAPEVIVVIITGYGTLQTAIEAIRYGVFDYISKPFNVPEIIQIIERAVQRKRLNAKVREFLKEASEIIKGDNVAEGGCDCKEGIGVLTGLKWGDTRVIDNQTRLEFAKVLARTLEERDPYTFGHSERVCQYCDLISKRLPLKSNERMELQIASYLHDIGKIGISDRFINKHGILSDADWEIIKQHTKKSIQLLAPLRLSPNITSWIQHHHEHYDGTGYPDGLSGEQIPIGARIIAISDSYDGMTSARPYRKPISAAEAINELLRCAGKQFDPDLVNIFVNILQEKERVVSPRNHSSSQNTFLGI